MRTLPALCITALLALCISPTVAFAEPNVVTIQPQSQPALLSAPASNNIGAAAVSTIPDQEYNYKKRWLDKGVTPIFSVMLNGSVLKGISEEQYWQRFSDVDGSKYDSYDYYYRFDNNHRPGKASLTIVGINNFKGSKTVYFDIYVWLQPGPTYCYDQISFFSKGKGEGYFDRKELVHYYIGDKTYTGKAKTPALKVESYAIPESSLYGRDFLEAGTDYTLSFKNNVKPGKATVTITGKGSFRGSVSQTFKIVAPVSKAKVASIAAQTYTGKAITPKPKVTFAGKTLKLGTDYVLSYKNNKLNGKATLTVEGKGFYTGSVSKTFIIQAPISKGSAAKIAVQSYAGKAVTPKPKLTFNGKTLKLGTDYTLSYKNNNKVGTATIVVTGKGYYKGTKNIAFKIANLMSGTSVASVAVQAYTGKVITPKPKVVFGGRTLKLGTDYTISYKNNKKVGTATIILAGKGNFIGSKSVKFKIAYPMSKAKVSVGEQTYTGKDLKPKPKVTYNGKTLKLGTDYTLSYANNRAAGRATVIVTGKGNYTGTAKATFAIRVPMSMVSVSSIPTQAPATGGVKPSPDVKFGSTYLWLGTDYTLSYKNNTKGGTATVIVTGKGKYKGSKSVNFKILPWGVGSTITKAEYNRIKLGMSYDEVKCLIGGPGKVTYEYSYTDSDYEIVTVYDEYLEDYVEDYVWHDFVVEEKSYEWRGNTEYSYAQIDFKNGVVESMSQYGLK